MKGICRNEILNILKPFFNSENCKNQNVFLVDSKRLSEKRSDFEMRFGMDLFSAKRIFPHFANRNAKKAKEPGKRYEFNGTKILLRDNCCRLVI